MSDTVDWQAVFFDQARDLPARLTKVATRRFGNGPEAEAAYNFALDAVSANDWQKLRENYAGRGQPQNFLRITFCRLLEEYGVRKYGRRRPPVWVQRLGDMWTRIYRMLCLQRMPAESIVDHVCSGGDADAGEVRLAIAQVRGRIPDCGQYVGEYTEGDATPEQHAGSTPQSRLEQGDLATILQVLRSLVSNDAADTKAPDDGDGVATALAASLLEQQDALREALSITDTERILLRLVYQDGFKVARAARMLKLHEQKVRRMHKAVIARVGDALRRFGVDASTLRGLSGGEP